LAKRIYYDKTFDRRQIPIGSRTKANDIGQCYTYCQSYFDAFKSERVLKDVKPLIDDYLALYTTLTQRATNNKAENFGGSTV